MSAIKGKWFRLPLDKENTIIFDVYMDDREIKVYHNGIEIPCDIIPNQQY